MRGALCICEAPHLHVLLGVLVHQTDRGVIELQDDVFVVLLAVHEVEADDVEAAEELGALVRPHLERVVHLHVLCRLA